MHGKGELRIGDLWKFALAQLAVALCDFAHVAAPEHMRLRGVSSIDALETYAAFPSPKKVKLSFPGRLLCFLVISLYVACIACRCALPRFNPTGKLRELLAHLIFR